MIGRRPTGNQRVAATRPLVEAVSANTKAQPRARRDNEVSASRAWRQQHRHSIRASLARIASKPVGLILTVLVLGVAIALPLLFWVVIDNARGLSSGLRDAGQVTMFLKPSVNDRDAASYADQLRGNAAISAVTLRSPAQGLEEFRSLSGFGDALDALDGNPLPSVLIVTPQEIAAGTTAAARDATLIATLRSDSRVDLVQYDVEWRSRLAAILGFGTMALNALAALLGVAGLLIIGNTIRVDIQSRLEEIEVMQLIGASRGFIRRPFLYAGGWYGLFGGAAAVVIVIVIELTVAPALGQLLESYAHRFEVHGLGPLVALPVILGSAGLGWIGAWLATARPLASGYHIE
ncbi:MAG: permease-like cell division protein FtsX [Dokdonella sp.]